MSTFSYFSAASFRMTRTAALLLCGAAGLFAQAGSGTVTGTLTDPSGAIVPGAAVAILNTNTGVVRNTTTNGSGIYVGAFLQPDNYTVTVSKAGFATENRKNLVVEVGRTMTIDFSMTVQKGSDTITVTSETPVLDSGKTDVSQVVTSTDVENLPISGR